ncbi:prostatic acid phosphatase [Anopheles cruzii]|uniref:prostatic acid phosphatase n=1 Tax=Anopheles cruzii TaxID=68878 RepID=UPI0022EC9362|nr:prostatic acid phosphatase [Anopheles cruzii]
MVTTSDGRSRSSIAMLAVLMGLLLLCGHSSSAQEEEDKLIFAHVLFRHGDRTPIDPYPNDPWKDHSHWPVGWGELTNPGKMHHYQLGQWICARYDTLLKKTYSNDEIYVRSTDVDRTLMSAEAHLAGLYPPQGADVWDSAITWQPIPVHTVPEDMDHVLASKKRCPAFEHALKEYRRSEPYQSYNRSLASLYDYLTEHTGQKFNSMTMVQNLYSVLTIEQLNNFTLPDWTKSVYPEPLATVSANTFAVKTNTTTLARLKKGPLVKEILERFRAKARGQLKPNRSLWIYSAHDLTVASLLNAMGMFEPHNPPFTACIMLELRQPADGGQPYVQVFYKNTTDEPFELSIPGCGLRCNLNDMFSIYSDILPSDWTNECKRSILTMTYVEANLSGNPGVVVGIALTLSASVVVLLAMVCIAKQRNRMDMERLYLRA